VNPILCAAGNGRREYLLHITLSQTGLKINKKGIDRESSLWFNNNRFEV